MNSPDRRRTGASAAKVRLTLTLAVGLFVGCTESPCPEAARPFVEGDRVYCTFPSTVVIIGGFDCPPELPYGVAIEGGIICTDEPTERGELPAEVCGPSCEPPEVREPIGTGRWTPIPMDRDRYSPSCAASGDGRLFVYGGARNVGGVSERIAEPRLFDGEEWQSVSDAPRGALLNAARTGAAVAWLGDRVAVLGGEGSFPLGDGALWDAPTNTWFPMGEPRSARLSASMHWTGTHLLVFGGFTSSASGDATNELIRFDPASNTWDVPEATGAPSARAEHVALWTGRRLFVWGGRQRTTQLGDGAIFDPSTGRWDPVPAEGAPTPRSGACSAWTGEEVLVWGGTTVGGSPATGAAYNIATRRWRELPTENAPPGRAEAQCVWTGQDLVLWGGQRAGVARDDGAAYDPVRDEWRAITSTGAPSARFAACAVPFRGGALVFGGGTSTTSYGDGAVWTRE